MITAEFDKGQYVIHQINVNTNNQHRPIYHAQSRMMADSAMAESKSANLQQNSSTIQVNVNGSIRLIN